MKSARTVLALVAALLIASPLLAADGKKKDSSKGTIPYFKTIDLNLSAITLTDEQKTKLDGIKKEYEQKLRDAYAKQDDLTPEQKKAAEAAKKAAKEAGKDRKETQTAIDAAVKKTADQKQQEKEARKQLYALRKEVRSKVLDLLTPEQKAQIDAAKKKGAKPAKADASAKPDAPAKANAPAATK